MSREIKFRAYDKKKEMWTNYKILDDTVFCMDKVTGVWHNHYRKRFKDFELSQYTGLKDKNGKEIYENDLISCNKYKNIIVFFEEGCFKVKYRKTPTTTITCALNSFLEKYKCKISGNIHEHPELLEVKK
nr:MAG TPA: YopX protein [Caudoviricetes sp.]